MGLRGKLSALLSRLTIKLTRGTTPAPDDEPALVASTWHEKDAELAGTGMATMARQLPALIMQAFRLAWEASPLDTAATIGLNLVGGIFTAFGLLATAGVLDALFQSGPTPHKVRAAIPSLVLVGGAIGLRAGLQAIAGWAQARLEPQVERIVELRLYDLTTAVELAALDDSAFLDAMQRAESRGTTSATMVVNDSVNVLTGAVGLVAAAGTLGVLHPVLLPLLLLTAVPQTWSSIRSARLQYMAMLTLVSTARRKWILSTLMTQRGHGAEIRSFTVRDFLLEEYGRLAVRFRDVQLAMARQQTTATIIGDVFKGVTTALVYVALGLLLWSGTVPLAVAGTAVLAIRTGQASLANLVYSINRCYEDGLYFGDYQNFCADAVRRLPSRQIAAEAPARFDTITADDVTFTYPGADKPSLRGVSVELRAGEVVALVGENGSGKTTLAKILAGLYDPDLGVVRWDDTDLAGVDPDRLRRNIAVIAQDHTHWPMTARSNIVMGRRGPEPLVERAAAESGADEVVAELKHGLDTLLDRRFQDGAELSGGQWQRLAVARGFYRDAPLLICDEPTAALDARAEHSLFERIRAHADGRTVLLITHRLASVRHADRIYVLDHGKVVEQGDHAALMDLGGLYADLYGLQASAYDVQAGGYDVQADSYDLQVSD